MSIQATIAPQKTPRSGALDAIRVVGIIAVIAGHTWDNVLIRGGLYTWHVPIFFVLSGYLWSAKRSVRQEIFKRSRTLLLPYAVWLAIISIPYLVNLVRKGELGVDSILRLVLGGSYIGRPFSAFWFVTALFVAVLVYRVLQMLPLWAQLVILTAVLGMAYTAGPILAKVPLSAGVAVPCVAFLMAGNALRLVRARIARPGLVGLGVLLLGFGPVVAGISEPLDLKPGNFGTPGLSFLVATLISCGLILIGESVFSPLSPRINAVFSKLAVAGFMVILTHAFVLWGIGATSDAAVYVFIVVLVVPWAAALIISRTRCAPALLGSMPKDG